MEKWSNWKPMNDEQLLNLIGSFVDFADEEKITFEKFDYTKEADLREYYKNNFPKFTEQVIDILIKASNQKIKNVDNGIKKINKDITLNFN